MPASKPTKHLKKGKKLQRTRPLDIKLGSSIKGESQDATYAKHIEVSDWQIDLVHCRKTQRAAAPKFRIGRMGLPERTKLAVMPALQSTFQEKAANNVDTTGKAANSIEANA